MFLKVKKHSLEKFFHGFKYHHYNFSINIKKNLVQKIERGKSETKISYAKIIF